MTARRALAQLRLRLGAWVRSIPSKLWSNFPELILVCCAVVLWPKLSAGLDAGPVHAGDQKVWWVVGRHPFWSRDFFFGIRPFVVPWVHKIFAFDENLVVQAQAVVASLAWVALAIVFACQFPRLIRVLGMLLLLVLANAPNIEGWDCIIRSESLSISFLSAFFASALLFVNLSAARHGAWAAGATAFTLLFAFLAVFCRDAASYVIVCFLPFFAGAWFVCALSQKGQPAAVSRRAHILAEMRRTVWRYLGLIAGLCLVLAIAQYNLRSAERYRGPLMNVVFHRVLPRPSVLAFFQDELGMPVSGALMSRKKKWHSSNNFVVFKAPEYLEFRQWLSLKGYVGYQKYLATHLSESLAEAEAFFSQFLAGKIPKPRGEPRFWTNVSDTLFDPMRTHPHESRIGIGLIALAALLSPLYKTRVLGLFSAACLLAAILQTFVAFHGDAMEVQRHGILVSIMMQLAYLAAIGVILAEIVRFITAVAAKFGPARPASPEA